MTMWSGWPHRIFPTSPKEVGNFSMKLLKIVPPISLWTSTFCYRVKEVLFEGRERNEDQVHQRVDLNQFRPVRIGPNWYSCYYVHFPVAIRSTDCFLTYRRPSSESFGLGGPGTAASTPRLDVTCQASPDHAPYLSGSAPNKTRPCGFSPSPDSK